MARLKQLITSEAMSHADKSHGRELFGRVCAQCHTLFGEGRSLGPDLTVIQRDDPERLIADIVNPSARVARQFQVTLIETDAGRVVTGMLEDETDQQVVIRTVNETVPIETDGIVARKLMPESLMPKGVLRQLSNSDIQDLFCYLMSRSKPEPPLRSEKPKGSLAMNMQPSAAKTAPNIGLIAKIAVAVALLAIGAWAFGPAAVRTARWTVTKIGVRIKRSITPGPMDYPVRDVVESEPATPLSLLDPPSYSGADWPGWRGTDGNNSSLDARCPTVWSEAAKRQVARGGARQGALVAGRRRKSRFRHHRGGKFAPSAGVGARQRYWSRDLAPDRRRRKLSIDS